MQLLSFVMIRMMNMIMLQVVKILFSSFLSWLHYLLFLVPTTPQLLFFFFKYTLALLHFDIFTQTTLMSTQDKRKLLNKLFKNGSGLS